MHAHDDKPASFHSSPQEAIQAPPEPFDPDCPEVFLGWLNATTERTGISRYLWRVLDERPALRARFPQIPSADGVRFLECATGVRHAGL